MTILKIIGWIIIIMAGGSFIYSTFFHLSGYLLIKKRAKNEKENEIYGKTSEKINWGLIILFQAMKLVLVMILLYFLL